MKNFMFFESTEGGLDTLEATGNQLENAMHNLIGWMEFAEDAAMLKWAEAAEIGDYFEHRLGYLVRLRDI